ncbi:MAG: protein phosphatase 2C domain-containing protein [Lachnospiraceae bacterium]|nr:protein phosphatase 2C domain-containing protein [Lachnospiraceae bacterium]
MNSNNNEERRPPKRLLSYQVGNLQGIGSRERQEDSFAFANAMDVTEILRQGLLAIVADGMGGMQDGKVASECVISTMLSDFEAMDRNSDLSIQFQRSVHHANNEVFRRLGGDGGSTVVGGIFFQEKLYFVSVGDSFIYLLRDGRLSRINREHNCRNSIFLKTIRAGSMDPEDGRSDPEEAALTQFVGMDELSDIDAFRRPLQLKNRDVLLFCSDGVGGVLSEEEIRECLLTMSPPEACIEMEQRIYRKQRPHQDNFTALVIRCGY